MQTEGQEGAEPVLFKCFVKALTFRNLAFYTIDGRKIIL